MKVILDFNIFGIRPNLLFSSGVQIIKLSKVTTHLNGPNILWHRYLPSPCFDYVTLINKTRAILEMSL